MTETTKAPRTQRKTRTGIVTSDKMTKTVTVTMTRRFAHAQYGKMMTRSTKVHARDEKLGAKIGDTVRIMETRPVSKTVRWRVIEIVERAK
jgi:small subunit ribosomal protein S17